MGGEEGVPTGNEVGVVCPRGEAVATPGGEEEGRGELLPPPPPPPELEEGVKVGRAEGESTGDPVGFKGDAVGGATLPLPPPEVEE